MVFFNNLRYILESISHRRMLKYTPKSKITLADILNRNANTNHHSPNNPLDPKHLPTRPPHIILPKKTPSELVYEPVVTPKTARATYQNSSTANNSFSRSTHVTPDEKSKASTSYTLPLKEKPVDPEPSFFKPAQNKQQRKPVRADRSQRAFKTIVIQDISSKEEEKPFLRQTVSNASIWRNAKSRGKAVPLSPLKLAELRKQKNKSTYEETPFRKKIQSEYYSPYTPTPALEDYTKEFKPKIYSTTHSRENSTFAPEQEIGNGSINNGIEPLAFKVKGLTTGKCTPRGSQDKLTSSVNLRKDKLMNQTDPLSSYFYSGKQNIFSKEAKTVRETLPLTQQTTILLRHTSNLSLKNKEGNINIKIQDFQLGACKGEGRFGKVFPAVHRKTGCLVAIKQIKKEQVRLMLDQFVQQLKINMYANHPNVVKMYGFFSDSTYFYILMQYMQDGSLYKLIKTSRKLKQQQTTPKLYQICDAVLYLHSQDILHRDIKPENIVLSNGVCKLCDFGWATYSKQRRNTYCGTLDYVCPQILEGQSYDNFVDIWAIGVLAFQMLTGKAPFYHISRKETMKSIMNCEFSFPLEMSVAAKLFIKKALQKNPDERFTVQSLLKDRFLLHSAPLV